MVLYCLVASMSLPAARVQKIQAIMPHRKFEGHTGWVTNVIHLRGGERIMTCSYDGSLRVWDMERGKQIGKDWRDEGAGMNTITLSPDGKKVLSGSDDGAVRLWDIDTAKVIAKWTEHTAGVASLCWSRDGRRAVSGAYDGTVRMWDAETGKTILGPLELANVGAAVYSPDETMIAAGGMEFYGKPEHRAHLVSVFGHVHCQTRQALGGPPRLG
jgi:WD40 repeat protein